MSASTNGAHNGHPPKSNTEVSTAEKSNTEGSNAGTSKPSGSASGLTEDLPKGFKVARANPGDLDRSLVRLASRDLNALDLHSGDTVRLQAPGTQHASTILHARVMRAGSSHEAGYLQLDSTQRAHLGVQTGDMVQIEPAELEPARKVTLTINTQRAVSDSGFKAKLASYLTDLPLTSGENRRVPLVGGQCLMARITAIDPAPAAIVTADTVFEIAQQTTNAGDAQASGVLGYDDLGGLDRELGRIREMIEWPLTRPEMFAHLGIEPPRGVLLSGPPGSGKTLLARAVAHESRARFFHINGPEIVDRFYGASEAQLRKIFEDAGRHAPAIIFIDEIDAIAPKRDDLGGDRQVERRIVAQLLTLMDGLSDRGQIVVIAATNLPDNLDPASAPARSFRSRTADQSTRYHRASADHSGAHTQHAAGGRCVAARSCQPDPRFRRC